jgi:GTP-binding protein HflX
VANQIDRCDAAEMERARSLEPDVLFVSATEGLGLERLQHILRAWPASPAGEEQPSLAP